MNALEVLQLHGEELPPVRDVDGFVRWRVRVGKDELTCLECGETFSPHDICPRCGLRDDGIRRTEMPPAVPTLSYLREGEYELAW